MNDINVSAAAYHIERNVPMAAAKRSFHVIYTKPFNSKPFGGAQFRLWFVLFTASAHSTSSINDFDV